MPVLSKHAVLSGPVDFCCLPCEQSFRSQAEAEQHVNREPHTTKIAATAYSEKFADEGIRKVRQLFYCEACDTVISSSRKVQAHVTDEEHQFNKENGEPPTASSLFRRVGDGVIASESVLLSSAAWNGIVEESCAVCDCDWEELSAHLADVKHVINLILNKVQSGIGDTIFRKIDNSQFQCLTCNVVVPQADFVEHGVTRDHQRLHIQCRKAKRALDEAKRASDEAKRASDDANRKEEDMSRQDDKSNGNEKKEAKDYKSVGTEVRRNSNSTSLTEESQKQTIEEIETNDNKNEAEKTASERESQKKSPKFEPEKSNTKETVKKELIKIKKEPEPPVNQLLYDDLNTELELNSYMLNTLAGKVLCVLCNWEFDFFQYKMHLNMEHHKVLESMHKEEVKRLNENKIKGDKGFSKEKQMLYNMVDQLKEDNISANFVKDEADCSRCKAVLPLDLNQIVAHIDSHKRMEKEKKEAEAKAKKEREEAEAKAKREKEAAKETARKQQEEYYKENKITIRDKIAICTVCHAEMSNIKKCIIEHINGARHKRNAEQQPANESDYESYDSSSDESVESFDSMKKVRMDKFVVLFKSSKDDEFCLVNNTLCLSMASYTLTRPENLYCMLCEKKFGINSNLFFHINDLKHKEKMAALPVITTLKHEFIRMVRPNVFHCGICHEQIATWKALMHHIQHSENHHRGRMVCCFEMMTLRDARVTADALKFIAEVNEANGRTYFN